MEAASVELVKETWAGRMEQIEAALRRGYDPLPISAVTDMLAEGDAQVFFGENSTAVTRLYERGDKRICQIWLAGGDLKELLAMKDEQIEPFAHKMGCDRMSVIGRDGWGPFLTDYKPVARVYIKELSNG